MSAQPVDFTTPDNTFGVVSYGTPSTAPALVRPVALPSDEATLVSRLQSRINSERYQLELRDAYYRGAMRVADLGISLPPQLRNFKVALGWPRVAVDSLEMRLSVEGFRFPDATDVDEDLQAVWQANSLDFESKLAHLDALVFGRSYVSVGSGDDGDMPLITVESPLDMAVEWDARRRTIKAALRIYGVQGAQQATLYTPNTTLYLSQSTDGWNVDERDDHRLGVVPVVRFSNRARSYSRDGNSEITPEIMSVTDDACRTLIGMAVAREFYSTPQRVILGANEAAFQNADGTAKSAWDTYVGRVLALERDENGDLPAVHQFTAYDPSVFTKILDSYSKIMSSMTGLPPHMLGFTTDNPASADAIRSTDMGLKMRADGKCKMFGESWRDVMQLALRLRGSLPANAESIATVWADTAIPTPAATTDAIFKQIQAGSIPATSDVTLERLGYSAVERQRLEQDRKVDQGASLLQEIAHSLDAKTIRADDTVLRAASQPTTPAVNPAKAPTVDGNGLNAR